MKKETFEQKRDAELNEAYSGTNANRDSGMPLVKGSVVTILLPANDNEPLWIKEPTYYRWRTKGGEILSISQTGRRNNGLGLVGNSDKERNADLLNRLQASPNGELDLPIIEEIFQKKSMTAGSERLNNYVKWSMAL